MLGRLMLILVAACVLAGSAVASATDPKKRHNAADQAWATHIRIQRDDLGAGDWRVEPKNSDAGAPQGCKDPNLSDLIETGEAENPDFSRNGSFVGSGSSIFLTEAQAATAYRRITAQPFTSCLAAGFKRAMSGSRARLTILSSGPLAFGKPTEHFTAGRVRLRISGPAATIEGRITYYVYAQGRATALLMVSSFAKPLSPISPALERRLALLVATRMHH
jgi:hypothetical protein